ncbi:ABC transporter permease [bacterium]|nr:ABC transporter permease [bacterium]
MSKFNIIFRETATYRFYKLFIKQMREFLETVGNIALRLLESLKYIFTLQFKLSEVIEQSKRFAIDSLPITLTIVAMTAVIVSIQVAPELVKQGGKDYIGLLVALTMVREIGTIMSGFAIISMIGSAFASEIATMKVTDQIDALRVLQVSPIKYLFVPRILAGTIMMPFIVVIASVVGIIFGGLTAQMTSHEVSGLCYYTSVWHGLYVRDINIALFKASCFGGAIALVSSSCGYEAKNGAKGVGLATTKAVVWSFVTIVIIDYCFALFFYF